MGNMPKRSAAYRSPSLGREWIEIIVGMPVPVALPSPSLGREWIEIMSSLRTTAEKSVSLLGEGVD